MREIFKRRLDITPQEYRQRVRSSRLAEPPRDESYDSSPSARARNVLIAPGSH
jgi:methylphosphotriester-DNA--protein-cysteine methyltransferase